MHNRWLPELAKGQDEITKRVLAHDAFAERHVYLIALLGLAVFYGLDCLAQSSRSHREGAPVRTGRSKEEESKASTSPVVFWIHIVSFGVYNAMIAYVLLHREVETLSSLALFAIAIVLHFFVTDYGLNVDHKSAYVRIGRWVLVVAILVGGRSAIWPKSPKRLSRCWSRSLPAA